MGNAFEKNNALELPDMHMLDTECHIIDLFSKKKSVHVLGFAPK